MAADRVPQMEARPFSVRAGVADDTVLGRLAEMENEPLQDLVTRVVGQEGSSAVVESLRVEFLRFMSLLYFTDTTISPPPAIDAVWHEFILDTRRYRGFCSRYFGAYVDHVPDRSPASDVLPEDGAPRTHELLTELYEYFDGSIWVGHEAMCGRPRVIDCIAP